ncbi:MAG: hypothetical protein EON60_03385 [Alphaproteobacteria bacterium]|nr:MAG: hypothetical protein EON60_03385 [Alphaproteobacteria bacterium]
MALFTLKNASLNPLKYEQLNSEETVTTASSLPTSAAAQMASGAEKNILQGAANQAATLTPLRPLTETTSDAAMGTINAAANTVGAFGGQADTQSFTAVSSAINTSAGSNLSATAQFGTAANAGDTAQSNSSSISTNNETNIINPTPDPTDPQDPTDPTNPGPNPTDPNGPPPQGTSNPDVTVNLNTGLLPDVHLDVDVSQTLQPVTNLLENTVEDILSGNPQTVTNLLTNTLGAANTILTGGSLNAALGNIPLLGQGNAEGNAQLINLGLGSSTDTPVAPLLDVRALQNLSSLSEVTLPNLTETVPNLLQNPVGTVTDTLNNLVNGNGLLAEITLGGDSSQANGTLLDLNVLDNLPVSDIPVAGQLLDTLTNTVPLGNTTLAGALNGTTQLLNISAGDTDETSSLIADVNLLGNGNLISAGIPLLGADNLITIPLSANGLPEIAATLTDTSEGVQPVLQNVQDVLTSTGNGTMEDLANAVQELLGDHSLDSITTPINGALTDILDTVQDGLVDNPAAEALAGITIEAAGNLADILGNSTSPEHVVSDAIETAGNLLGSMDSLTDPISNIVENVTNPLGHIIEQSTTALGSTLDNLTNVCEIPVCDLPNGDILSTLLETTSHAVTGTLDTSSSIVGAVAGTTECLTDTLLQPLNCTPLEPVADVVSTLASTAVNTVESAVQHTSSSVAATVDTTTTAVSNVLSNIVNSVTSPAPSAPAPLPPITKIITSPLHGLFG